MQRALRAASFVAGWYTQWPAQAALTSLIECGLLARHVRKVRREYASRHERILAALTSKFDDWLEPVASVTGMHLAARLRSRSTRMEGEIAELAREADIGFDRLSVYCAARPAQAGLVLGYGAIASADIDEGLRRLRRCFMRAAASAASGSGRGD
jgi:GntR family transcriptional regulator/MocR family aminotransferase